MRNLRATDLQVMKNSMMQATRAATLDVHPSVEQSELESLPNCQNHNLGRDAKAHRNDAGANAGRHEHVMVVFESQLFRAGMRVR